MPRLPAFTLAWHDSGEAVANVRATHATTIRREATALAESSGRSVRVMRGDACAYVMDPDGTRRPPDGAVFEQRENCTRSADGPACFCTACRADRRAGRPTHSVMALDPDEGDDANWQRFLDGTL